MVCQNCTVYIQRRKISTWSGLITNTSAPLATLHFPDQIQIIGFNTKALEISKLQEEIASFPKPYCYNCPSPIRMTSLSLKDTTEGRTLKLWITIFKGCILHNIIDHHQEVCDYSPNLLIFAKQRVIKG